MSAKLEEETTYAKKDVAAVLLSNSLSLSLVILSDAEVIWDRQCHTQLWPWRAVLSDRSAKIFGWPEDTDKGN